MKTSPMKIELVDHMGSDLSVVNAARVSFDKVSSAMSDKDMGLIQYLARHNHHTPFCHAFMSFRVKVPIYVARQLVKHKVGGEINEVSRRYVDTDPEFYFPQTYRGRATNKKQGSLDTPVEDQLGVRAAAELNAARSLSVYKLLLGSGVAPEQAREVLPLNMMTEFIWSGTLLFFARICKLRLDAHAQAETAAVARVIHENMLQLFPISTDALLGTL